MISGAKAKFRQMQTDKTIGQAEQLSEMRKERIRVEGQAKIDKQYRNEKDRIRQAKRESLRGRTEGIRRFAKGVQKTMKKGKARGGGFNAGGSSNVFGGSGGVFDVGGSSEGFNAGGVTKAKPKKRKGITIHIDK